MIGADCTGAGWRRAAGIGALGVVLTLFGAPAAAAEPDPADPADPAAPAELITLPAEAADPAVIAAATPVGVASGPAESLPASPGSSAIPPEGVPHLPSPENLPPGATQAPPEGRTLGYLRDLWHAIRTQDVTGADALLLLTQRPMDARAIPPQGVASSPTGPPGSTVPATAPDPAAGPVTADAAASAGTAVADPALPPVAVPAPPLLAEAGTADLPESP